MRAQCVRTRMYVGACECRPMRGRVCVRGVLMDVYVCALVYVCMYVHACACVSGASHVSAN